MRDGVKLIVRVNTLLELVDGKPVDVGLLLILRRAEAFLIDDEYIITELEEELVTFLSRGDHHGTVSGEQHQQTPIGIIVVNTHFGGNHQRCGLLIILVDAAEDGLTQVTLSVFVHIEVLAFQQEATNGYKGRTVFTEGESTINIRILTLIKGIIDNQHILLPFKVRALNQGQKLTQLFAIDASGRGFPQPHPERIYYIRSLCSA